MIIDKPKRPTKKTMSFSVDDRTESIIIKRAMKDYYGNFSEALRNICQEWSDFIDSANSPTPQ